MTKPKTSTIEWLYFVRGIAIICIVIGHCTASPLITRLVFSFHVPVFFVVSGFLFAEHNSLSSLPGPMVRKRFRSTLFPYITTGIIFYLCIVAAWLFNRSMNSNQVYPLSYPLILGERLLLSFLYGTGSVVEQLKTVISPVGTLWFLPSFFCSSVLFYFIMKLLHKYSLAIQLPVICAFTFAGYMLGKYLFLPWSLDISLVSQLFVFSGYVMSRNRVFTGKPSFLLMVAAAGIWAADMYTGYFSLNERSYTQFAVLSLAGAAAGSYLLMNLSWMLSSHASRFYYRTISYIGRQSLVILCFHNLNTIIMVNPVRTFRLWLYMNNYWIILSMLSLGYSLLAAEIIKRVTFLRSIYYAK